MNAQEPFCAAPELKSAIDRAENLLSSLEGCGRIQQTEMLREVIESARKMRFSIGVVGQAKRGKSTLINGLLGRQDDVLAPVNRFPATNVVSCFAHGAKEEAKVLFGSDGKDSKIIPTSDIKHFACEEFNPGNQKGVKAIEVVGSFPRLGRDVVLVDTPGADNALSNLHDIVLLDFLPRLDAVIFLVTADEPLTASELELLKQVKKADVKKLLFAINKSDKCEPEDLSQGVEHNRRVLADAGYGDAPMFAMSAKSYQKLGTDDGTEKLLSAVGEILSEGRVRTIVERLTDIVNRAIVETKHDLASELQMCEMTTEQAGTEIAELDSLQKRLAETRPKLERKFRTTWINALSEFEDALPSIEKQLISEFGDLIECTSPLKLQALSQTIHTSILKRMDELLAPPTQKLRVELEQAGKTLEVEYRNIPGIAPRQMAPARTSKDLIASSVQIGAAGVPAAVGAIVLSSLPGLVGSAIALAAPTVATVTLNPLTWIAAAGTGTAAAATGAASGAATALLSPLAAIGAPLLIGYAGFRVFTAWKSKLAQSKTALSLAVKDLIIAAIAETRENFKQLRKKDEAILMEFNNMFASKLEELKGRLDEILKNRPAPERIAKLKDSLRLLSRVEPVKSLPSSDADGSSPRSLFPT